MSTHQIPFAEKMRTLDNYCILKIIYDKSNLNEGVVDYTKHFLSFAKKVSLVSKCKKFNQMVQDCTLNIVAKCKKVGSFHSGTLNIINSRV